MEMMAGLPGDGVPRAMRSAVSVAANAGRSALLALPGDADAIRARDELSASCPIGVRVATLEGVVEAEWALQGDGKRLAGGLGRDVLLARALVAAGVADRPGRGAIALLGTLAERSGAVLPVPAAAGDLADRIIDALSRYRSLLRDHGMVERSEACSRLADFAAPAEVIAVDGFVRLPREFETLLLGWSASGARVVVSVAGRPDRAGSAACTPFVERMLSAGASLTLLESEEGARPAELERARRELFEGAEPGCGAGAVALAVAAGEEAEARHIATTVAALVRRGTDPGKIVLLFGDARRHAAWIRRALHDESILADVDASVAVGETAFGAALLTLRAAAVGGFVREGMTALLHSPFSGVVTSRADESDLAWRRSGTQRGRSLLKGASAAGPLIEEFVQLWKRPIGSEEVLRWKKLADHLFANGYPGVAPVPDEDALAEAAVHRSLCRALQEAVEIGDGEIEPAELWERFAASRVMPAAPHREGRVLVTSVDRIPLDGRAHVVLGGLTASEFPRRGSEDRLEGDAVGRVLGRLGIEADPAEHALEERRAFYLAVAGAQETLTLVRRGSDDEGTPLRESVFWDEFLDLYRRPGSVLPKDAFPQLTSATVAAGSRQRGARAVRGELAGAAGLEDLASITHVSPSEIESYLACPYKWFIERRVRASTPDRALDVAAAGGLAHAALAAFYREWAGAAPDGRVTPELREQAMNMAMRIAEDTVRAEGSPDTLEGMTLLDSVVPSVVALVGRDAEFLPGCAPAHIEWAFGRSGEVDAIDLGGVSLVGRADRIDVGPEGLVIVDYKRTHASSLAQIRERGLVQLQLYALAASKAFGLPVAGGLYRSLKDGSDRGFVLGGVGSFNRNDTVDAARLAELLAEGADAALGAVARMRDGRIAPTPSDDACKFCAAASFCARAAAAV